MRRLIMLVAVCMTLSADAASNIPIISDLSLKDAIVAIDPVCSNSTSIPATITVTADHAVRVYTYCKDGHKDNIIPEDDLVHYIAKVYYSGNTSEKCVFKTNPNSDFYQIALEVFYLQDGVLSYKDAFVVTCTYSTFANTSTQSHDLREAMVAPYETYKHIHRSHDVQGSNSSSTFTIDVLDIREKLVTGIIPLGQKIKLRATMTAGSAEERGFHVFHCDAVGSPGIPNFGFIREGCGEGVIIGRTEGFETTGLIAESPYFQAFNMFGSKYLKFVCHFYVCHSVCDGASCMHSTTKKRKKRHVNSSKQKNSPGVHHTVERIKDIDIWKRNGAISRGILNDMKKISITHNKNEKKGNVRVQEELQSIKQDPTQGDKVYKTNKKEDIFTPQNEDQIEGHISIEHVQYANQDNWHDMAPTLGDKAFQMGSRIKTKTENIPTTLNPRNTTLFNKEWTEQQIPVNHDQYANSDHPEEMAPHVRIITGVLMFMAIISLIVLFIVLKRNNCRNTENTQRNCHV